MTAATLSHTVTGALQRFRGLTQKQPNVTAEQGWEAGFALGIALGSANAPAEIPAILRDYNEELESLDLVLAAYNAAPAVLA